MSSTNRGAVRRDGDFYPTPAWCVEAIVPHLPWDKPDLIIDPGCGDGAIIQALRDALAFPRALGIETHPQLAAAARATGAYEDVIEADFLRWAESDQLSEHPQRLVLMNPPYGKALEFVQASLAIAQNVIALLRLPFLAGLKRRDWHRAHPCDVFVLPKRPSFSGKGTDRCDYMWASWGPGPRGRVTIL